MSRITERQLDEVRAQAGLGHISRETLQAFLDGSRWRMERQKTLARLLALARGAAYQLDSGLNEFDLWIRLAVASGLVSDFYEAHERTAQSGRSDITPLLFGGAVIFWSSRDNLDEARKFFRSITESRYCCRPRAAVTLACASHDPDDYQVAREAIGRIDTRLFASADN